MKNTKENLPALMDTINVLHLHLPHSHIYRYRYRRRCRTASSAAAAAAVPAAVVAAAGSTRWPWVSMRRRWSWSWWNLWWSWNWTPTLMLLLSPLLLLLPSSVAAPAHVAAAAVCPQPPLTSSSGSCRHAADSRSTNSAAHCSKCTSCHSDSHRTALWPDSVADWGPHSWGRSLCLDSDAVGAAPRVDAAPYPLKPNLIPRLMWYFCFWVFFFFESESENIGKVQSQSAGSKNGREWGCFLEGKTQRKWRIKIVNMLKLRKKKNK